MRVAVFWFVTIVALGAVMLGQSGVGAQSTPEPTNTSEDAEVRAVLEDQLAAWAAGDGAAFGATVSEDSDLITFDGTHLTGRQEIATYMQQQFDGILAGTHVVAEPVRIRFLSEDTAVMITKGGVVFPGETAVPAERQSIQTFVLRRVDGQWLVEAFQNTRIAPPRT